MSQITITLLMVPATVILSIWNGLPAAIVAAGSALALYFTGVLNMRASATLSLCSLPLLAISTGLKATGAGTWAGKLRVRHSRTSQTSLLAAIFVLSALFTVSTRHF